MSNDSGKDITSIENKSTECELPATFLVATEQPVAEEVSPGSQTEKFKREMQQLIFYNPGPSTKDLLGFKPEFSNREKRKLNRLIHDKNTREKSKHSLKPTVHDEDGRLISSAKDLCDCMIEECPGCHYPCPQCSSEKCGSTCRSRRKWTYDFITMNGKK